MQWSTDIITSHYFFAFQDSFYNARIIISTDPEDVDVLVFTRRNPTKPQRLVANDTLSRKSNFDPSKITKILIHGFSAGMYFAHRFVNGEPLETSLETKFTHPIYTSLLFQRAYLADYNHSKLY